MDDLVERLKAQASRRAKGNEGLTVEWQAAAEITALRERFNELEWTLRFVYPALLVLKTMCKKARLGLGANKANEMLSEMERVMPELPALSSLRSAKKAMEGK